MRNIAQFAKVVADCGPLVPLRAIGAIGAVGGVREDFAVILVKNATMGGIAKHQLPIAWKSIAPAAAPAAKLATATHMRRNRARMASRAGPCIPRIISAISI